MPFVQLFVCNFYESDDEGLSWPAAVISVGCCPEPVEDTGEGYDFVVCSKKFGGKSGEDVGYTDGEVHFGYGFATVGLTATCGACYEAFAADDGAAVVDRAAVVHEIGTGDIQFHISVEEVIAVLIFGLRRGLG